MSAKPDTLEEALACARKLYAFLADEARTSAAPGRVYSEMGDLLLIIDRIDHPEKYRTEHGPDVFAPYGRGREAPE